MRLFTPTTRTTTARAITTRRLLTHRILFATRLPTTTPTTNHHGNQIRAYSSEKGTPPPPPSHSTFNPETYLQIATTTLSLIPPKLIPDTLHPTQSHLLSLALSSHLPSICLPAGFNTKPPSHSPFPWPTQEQTALPPGYHLVYFPLQTPPHLLFPDGTDADHCPGAPFTRRMWAGGRIEFDKGSEERFKVDGRKTVCVERVGVPVLQVGNSGKEQDQRVWVDVWRRYFTFPEGIPEKEMERVVEGVVRDLQTAGAQEGGTTTPNPPKEGVISELRRLVFLRERPERSEPSPKPNQNQQNLEPAPARVIKVPHQPDFSFTLTPDATLLFQFSALTFNAHAIHLDPLYAREVEGYKERLVHGPLTLVVMLRGVEGFLRGATGIAAPDSVAAHPGIQISEAIKEKLSVPPEEAVPEQESGEDGKKMKKKQWEIANIEYKNLRPLFVGEEMKVCVRLLPNKEKKSGDGDGDGDKAGLGLGFGGPRRERVDVWIEAPDGGLAVKGTVGIEWR